MENAWLCHGSWGSGARPSLDAYVTLRPTDGAAPAWATPDTVHVGYALLGLVLRAAVARAVADYLQEKIWDPIGAEADATWLIDKSGQDVTFCCRNAVLRDYARLGRLLAHDGNWRGRQTWIFPGERRMSAFIGVRGQSIFVDPQSRLVMVHTAVRKQAVDPQLPEETALWRGVLRALGG